MKNFGHFSKILYLMVLLLLGGPSGCMHSSPQPGLLSEKVINPKTNRHLLNSERILALYGDYNVNVVCQKKTFRISDLKDGAHGTTRTLAIVKFTKDSFNKDLEKAYSIIKNGGSIGKTLKDHGWSVEKTILFLGEATSDQIFDKTYTISSLPLEHSSGILFYLLSALKGNVSIPFAFISEIYHYEYLNLKDLLILYPGHHKNNFQREFEESLDFLLNAKVHCSSQNQ